MKKLLKKLELKPLLISVGLVIFQSIFFFTAKLLQGEPHLIGNTFDHNTPFISFFILFYVSWYLLLFIVPYYLYKKDKPTLYKYIAAYSICAVTAAIIFVIYPTTLERGTLGKGVFDFITSIIYWVDTPAINCLPSLHCAISMLFILVSLVSKKVTNKFRIPVITLSILIMISTLLVKQHVLIDLITGDILMLVIFIIVNYSKNIVNFVQKLLKI